NLDPWYASEHFDSTISPHEKVVQAIAHAHYGIYDLSYFRLDDKGAWQMPRDVFIELGMAISLNRPTLLLWHGANQEAGIKLPSCLDGLNSYIVQFSGKTTLKQTLQKYLPKWVNTPPEQAWRNRYCIFGGKICRYREEHPRIRQWEKESLHCHIADGRDVDRPDFRAVVEEVLERFNHLTFVYIDDLQSTTGYDFLLCTHCQTIRSTPFGIYRISSQTPAEAYIAIGMCIGLEMQFDYKIPKMIIQEGSQDVPPLLSAYSPLIARTDRDVRGYLQRFTPTVLQQIRRTKWKPQPLPFIEANLETNEPTDQSAEAGISDKTISHDNTSNSGDSSQDHDPSSNDQQEPGLGTSNQSPSPTIGSGRVFISYNHKDKRFLEELHLHLAPFVRSGALAVWDDSQIQAGTVWVEEIKSAIESADVAILLISPDFLASDFISEEELPKLLAAAEQRGMHILSIIVRPCLFTQTPLARYQSVNNPDKPLSNLRRDARNKTWADVARIVADMVTK
ncbi:MAG TPA: toll/interleukin-1 receptor domain-containing protein, partial [Ktedonobacteraceae bacterium]|nr:toll/interleukin-1 receptor domain-containing protein [Ktedonobacteraceae bacterium]